MKVLVTGANGMLGQDLCPALEKNGFQVFKTDIDNLDITNQAQVDEVLKQNNPDFVIHCAAYTNVDKAEEDTEIAFKINAQGTENIAKTCANLDIPLVFISTDYVFDGTKKEQYKTDDKTNPISVYGESKLQGEEAVKKYCEKFYITRTSWLYGKHGKNFIETMINLSSKNNELKVVDDQMGCPTWTMELVNGILKLIKEKSPYGIYHLCGNGQTSWYGLAKEIFNQMNIDIKVTPCNTDEFPRPAKRPKYSVMSNSGFCREWKLALKDYIELRGDK